MTLAIGRAAMLRIHRHYIPALVLVVVVADLGVIALALSSSQALGYPNGDGAMWPKAFVLTGVTLLALSLADLYQLDFRIRRVELTCDSSGRCCWALPPTRRSATCIRRSAWDVCPSFTPSASLGSGAW